MIVNTSSQRLRHASRRASGFTLVELLMVVGIMLIVIKLMLPSLKGMMGGTAGSVARSQLIGDLNRARTMALNNGAPVYMVFMPAVSPIDYDKGEFVFVDPKPRNFDVRPTEADIELVEKNIERVKKYIELLASGQVQALAQAEELKDKLEEKLHDMEMMRRRQIKAAEEYLLDPKEGNDLLGKQAVAYAMYAEYLPGDQPGDPSKHWLTDWKRLPDGFYFTVADLNATRILAAAGDQLTFSHLKNGHSRNCMDKWIPVERRMLLPYLMFNGEGELSARGDNGGDNGGVRGSNFFISLAEGGLFQPAMDTNGTYFFEKAEREDLLVLANKGLLRPPLWLQINSITGHADVWEGGTGLWEEGEGRVHPTRRRIDLEIIAVTRNDAFLFDQNSTKSQFKNEIQYWVDRNAGGEGVVNGFPLDLQWKNPDPDAQGRRERQPSASKVKITNLPQNKFIGLMAHLKRIDPGIRVRWEKREE